MSRKKIEHASSIMPHGNFSFELLRQYPEARTFVIKKPFKGSMTDTFFELFGGKR